MSQCVEDCGFGFKQDACFGLVLGDVGEVIENDQLVFVEAGDGCLESKFAARDLQFLDQIGGAGEENAPAILDQAKADGGSQMCFAPAGRAEQDQVGAGLQPGVSGDKRHDTGFGNGWNGVEVEAGQGLARRQACFGEVTLDPPLPTFSNLVFGEGSEQSRRWPAFLVGSFGEGGPEVLDGRKAQFIEQEVQTRRVDGISGGHAASPVGTAARRAL